MTRKVLASALVALTVHTSTCLADADATSWVRLCSSTGVLETRLCQTYLQGFVGGYSITVAMTLPTKLGFCTPEGTTIEQVRRAVVTYAQKDLTREMLEQPFFSTNMLIYLALADAFPCLDAAPRGKRN